MIYARSKNCKSETPTRQIHSNPKITQLVGITKKSDPFLKELREVYDKENLNPNLKDNRVRSQQNKEHNQGKSPRQKPTLNKFNKTYHPHNYTLKAKEENLSSSSKYNSTQLSKGGHLAKSSNRKSTEHNDAMVTPFQEEYYNAKEDRRQKKMRVTLKDINKKRKSLQQNQQDYLCKFQEEYKESIAKDLIGSLKKQLVKSNEKSNNQGSSGKKMDWISQHHCFNHPEKKATHRLLQSEANRQYCEKCAVSLVTKGHRMQQIHAANNRLSTHQDELKQSRLQRLKDFLFQVDRLEPAFRTFKNDLDRYRSTALQKFQSEKQSLDSYFNRVRQEIQISHEKSLLNLKLFFDAVFEQLQKNDSLLNLHYQQVRTIKEDIVPNIDSIVEHERVTQQSFEEIIHNYCKNLRIIEMNLKQLSEYSYNTYYFNYQRTHTVILNIRQLITPEICIVNKLKEMITKGQIQRDQNILDSALEKMCRVLKNIEIYDFFA